MVYCSLFMHQRYITISAHCFFYFFVIPFPKKSCQFGKEIYLEKRKIIFMGRKWVRLKFSTTSGAYPCFRYDRILYSFSLLCKTVEFSSYFIFTLFFTSFTVGTLYSINIHYTKWSISFTWKCSIPNLGWSSIVFSSFLKRDLAHFTLKFFFHSLKSFAQLSIVHIIYLWIWVDHLHLFEYERCSKRMVCERYKNVILYLNYSWDQCSSFNN